jgi:hypothetical protein
MLELSFTHLFLDCNAGYKSKANSVFIWLGNGTESTDRAMRNLSSAGLLGESSIHDANLRLLQVLLHLPGRPIFPYDLLELLEIEPRPFRGKQKRRISELAKFCQENSKENPGQIRTRLESYNPSK